MIITQDQISHFKLNAFDLCIFGESHFEDENIEIIESTIRSLKADILMHELLDVEEGLIDKKKAEYLLKKDENNRRGVNIRDIYKMIIDLDCHAVGLDLPIDELENIAKLSLATKMMLREKAMLDIMNKYLKDKTYKSKVAVVGDTHLRSKDTIRLGKKSIIYKEFHDKDNVIIIRANKEDREIK